MTDTTITEAIEAAERRGYDRAMASMAPDGIAAWFMFDNHRFARLTGSVNDMLAQAAMHRAKDKYGMLCSAILTRGGEEVRRVGPCVQADSHLWTEECDEWKAALLADADVKRLAAKA